MNFEIILVNILERVFFSFLFFSKIGCYFQMKKQWNKIILRYCFYVKR